jgi:putative transposase
MYCEKGEHYEQSMYTDNGKIYRSQQFEWMCARLGCLLVHSKPFVPKGRGYVKTSVM